MKRLKRWPTLAKLNIMEIREEAISEILERLSSLTDGFTNPKLILIGGYAFRAYVDISRHTRDCDFVIRQSDLEQITEWLGLDVQAFHQEEGFGYLRLLKLHKIGNRDVKLSFDFMQGKVTGRTEDDRIAIDQKFVQNSAQTVITIGHKEIEFFIPDYTDYLILKLASARPGDIRDIAALIWKCGLPENLENRAAEIMANPDLLVKNISTIIQTISDSRFVDSWRGTFVTREFTEEDKQAVIVSLEELL